MAPPFQTITVCWVSYWVERVKDPSAHLIPVHFVLHSPRGRSYLVVPSKERPDRFIALSRFTHFSPYRPSPFAGTWFTVADDGTLSLASPDA